MPKTKLKTINSTKKILALVEKKDASALYKNNLAIKDINLLTEKLRKEPTLQKKIIKAIEEDKFDFNKFIDILRKEKTIHTNIKNKDAYSSLSSIEKKTYTHFLLKKSVPKHFASEIIELFSKNYTKVEIKKMIINILTIKSSLEEKQLEDFYKKVILGVSYKSTYLPEILEKIADPKYTATQKKALIIRNLPKLNKKSQTINNSKKKTKI